MLRSLPSASRHQVEQITTTAFTIGLNRIMLVAAVIVLASGVIAFATIRGKDFVHQGQPG